MYYCLVRMGDARLPIHIIYIYIYNIGALGDVVWCENTGLVVCSDVL